VPDGIDSLTGIRLALIHTMSVLPWRRTGTGIPGSSAERRAPGAYAGRARFRPREVQKLPAVLRAAVGAVVEFGFAGEAGAGQRFAGQTLYLEWCKDAVLHGFLIPEQDLEFLSAPLGLERDNGSVDAGVYLFDAATRTTDR
jgi:hypothetical protein